MTNDGGIQMDGENVFTNAGTYSGAGTFQGDFDNPGTMAPGSPVSIAGIDGEYAQTSAGRLEIECGGLLPGDEYDVLNITGDASLAGTLEVALLGGFEPDVGDSFDILLIWTLSITISTQTDPSGIQSLSGFRSGCRRPDLICALCANQ